MTADVQASAAPQAPLGARVLEIGDHPFFAGVFPAETTYWHVGYRRTLPQTQQGRLLGLARWPQVWRMLRDGAFDMIVVKPTREPPWSPHQMVRSLFSRHAVRGDVATLRMFGQMLPVLAARAPVVVIDFDDSSLLYHHHEILLKHAALYFKRELPVDRWRIYMGRVASGIPSAYFRHNKRRAERLERLRPLPIGLRKALLLDVPAPAEKTADVFFGGAVEGRSSHRAMAMAEVRALAEAGYVVDISSEVMPRDAFLRRCAAAWLVWSPEGLGWDCYRHYEAAAAWSVPLMNMPQIERHAPLVDGVHGVFYDISEGGLTRAVVAALADKPRLRRMAEAARGLVAEKHTPEAVCRYIVKSLRER